MCLPGLGRCASTGSAGTVALGGMRRAAPAKTTSPPSSVTRWTAHLTQRPCFDVRLDEVDWLGTPLSQVVGSVGAVPSNDRPVPRHHERVV
jgi:hypothetical protein